MSLLKDRDQSVSADNQRIIREGYQFEVPSDDLESLPDMAVRELRYMTTRMDVLVGAAAPEKPSASIRHEG
ncbi:hypothetical protein CPLU01_03024 [Colletotrichum plurivorum]|uniref:Uncharacterized protein n=1 Tax=Colletotrichum plurivorum TaxID=2175906 RepID=A0A8H6KTR6_9PEZI|nr:hypothetical protein CPLU01_03024 [Colletotrichum plurivorum]